MTDVEFGVDTFGDITVPGGAASSDERLSAAQVIRNVVDEAVLAEQVGIEFFGVGEHHRSDFAISAPEIVLGAIAARTERIRLGTAVTVLSSDDPVRVYERFATVDAISGGRAEVVLGRGSFTESFPLFGYELSDYEVLFDEKLELMAELITEKPVTWSGTTRASLTDQNVYPKTENGMKAWVGVGGSPESVVRAVHRRIPMMLAIIGGDPARFAPYADLYRRAQRELGSGAMPLAVHSPGFVAATDSDAADLLWEHYRAFRDRLGAERGWGPTSRIEFDREITTGSLYVGSPDTVATKIARTVQTLNADQFDMKYSNGTLPHEDMMTSLELYGTEVIPRVRKLLSD
ncbi:LLM class flavin-dependent oxidoreductase [Jongsikchunia kroppenstedtii]|uniref:LLM class flavin-dependent oxidoreductase n=1 Tax=Jongsikchunia kroppenstedtii TaxID=1121721 RepID=UPI000371544E|nr:LLM class flavin-dependent oxidoreductase [Jongsikchunia kroppenstedtii]